MTFWTYSATPQDEALAAEIGYLRQKPFFGQPERNRNYSEGDIWEMWQHSITALSEIAFARMLGMQDFVPTVNTFKGQPDVGEWEVRFKFPGEVADKPYMRFTGVDNLNAPYVLLTGGPTEKAKRTKDSGYVTPPFTAVGWIWGRDGMAPQFDITMWLDKRPLFHVPLKSLRSMDEVVVRTV
jgi:hypothetical protein